MKIRTHLKAGGLATTNHNEALKVRSTVKAGGFENQHNEALKVRSTVKAGDTRLNHNEALKIRSAVKAGGIRRMIKTTHKNDRLELLVVRAGVRAGRRT